MSRGYFMVVIWDTYLYYINSVLPVPGVPALLFAGIFFFIVGQQSTQH